MSQMTNAKLAPEIFRQRLLIEGYWSITLDEAVVRRFLLEIAAHLNLRTYGDPIVFSPASGMGKEENAGYDAFVPLIDSGISGYFWSKARFFSIVLYTCKEFEEDKAIAFTKAFFETSDEMAIHSF
jgi:hypothetical protein